MNDITRIGVRTTKGYINCVLLVGILVLSGIALTKEQSPPTYKEMLEAKDRKIQDEAITSILDERLRLVNTLIEVVGQASAEKSLGRTGNAAAFLLGKLRSPEAVPVLSAALAKVAMDPNASTSIDIDPLADAVTTALVEIGRPSIPAMITNITTSDDRMLRIRSMDVVYHVLGGKDNLIGLLNRLMEQKERKKEEKDRLTKAIEWAQSHYVETTKPLF